MKLSDSFTIHYGEIDSRRAKKIDKIASACKTKFSSATNFVRESLGLYIMWWTEPEQMMEEARTWYPHYTDEQLDYLRNMMRNPKAKNPDEFYENEIQKVIDSAGSLQELPFESHKGGDLRVDIDSGTFRDIQKIISEGDAKKRYPNWNVFFQEAVSLFTFWWTPGEIQASLELMYSIWPYMPTKIKEHWKNHEKFKDTFKNFIAQRNAWCKEKGIDPNELQTESVPETADKQLEADVRPPIKKLLEEPVSTQQLRVSNKAVGSWNLLCQELEDTKSFIDGMQIPSKTPADALPSDDYPLVWSFYSRLLPVKVVLTALADMISDSGEDKPVNYRHFREIAYEDSLGLAEILKQYETKWKVKRNEKMSTGLPLATFGLDMTDMEKYSKVKASKERFLEHFVGMKEEAWIKRQNSKGNKNKKGVAFFDGALNAMGLAYFKAQKVPTKSKKKKTDYEIKVGLTRLGADLVGLGNPILENYQREHWKNSLAEGEVDFILNKIIPRFPLESSLINKVIEMLDGVKENSPNNYLTTDMLDEQFDVYIRKWLQSAENKDNSYYKFIAGIRSDKAKIIPWRVATMGRLGEMRITSWKLEKGTGKSHFYPHLTTIDKISSALKATRQQATHLKNK